jgi:spermidine synthase
MKFKSFLRRFFLGNEVLEKIYSPINGEVAVVEDLFGKREMMIGRVAQSGGLAERLWEKISNDKFLIPNEFQNSNFQCLILGLGCGTVAQVMHEKFPLYEIMGVEIDPKVIELGKKYFGLGEIPNLKIVVGDAISLVQSSKFKVQSFDLVVVDLYLGQEFPKEAESEDFLRSVGSLVNKDGLVLFNRLYYNRRHRKLADRFVEKLTTVFSLVKTKKLFTNLLISASF